MKVLIATTNPAKFFDLKNALKDTGLQFVSLADLQVKEFFREEGKTFEENARKKALFYAQKTNMVTIADDGGLEIKVLKGEPGVKTRRWIDNQESSDEQLIKYTLLRMRRYQGKDRQAQLRAVICLALPSGQTYQVEGKIQGIIATRPYKTFKKGFPFDALLYLPARGKYYYQLKYEDKKPFNHRAVALQNLKRELKKLVK